jgi:hypothetical protein
MSIKKHVLGTENANTCSPIAQDNYKKWGTCMAPKEIRALARAWNMTHDKKTQIPNIQKASVATLVKLLNERFSPTCGYDNQMCWVEAINVQDKTQLKSKFRPLMNASWLRNKREWLSNFDINKCVSQYMEKYKRFLFLGAIPRDSMKSNVCSIYNMCNVNVAQLLEKGKSEIGIVFNLDRHHESGSHWVALYANFRPRSPKFGIFYYDSVGDAPPQEIRDFTLDLKKQVDALYDRKITQNFDGRLNVVQHQYKNTECGMYSMVFIILCLEKPNMNFYQVRELIPKKSDDEINELRQVLFSKPTPAINYRNKANTPSFAGSSRRPPRSGGRGSGSHMHSHKNP